MLFLNVLDVVMCVWLWMVRVLCVQNVGQTECAASEETEQTDGQTVAPLAAPSSSTESQVTSMVHTARCAGPTQL